MYLESDVLQRNHVELVAHILFGQIVRFNDCFTHARVTHARCSFPHAFWRTLSPSFKPTGGFTIKSSPPFNPSSIRTLAPLATPVFTARRTALPSSTTNTAPSRTAADGASTTGFA